MPTTEIATVPLLAGTSISDPETIAILQKTLAHLHKVDGFQGARFGAPFEAPENLQLLVDWASRQDHEAFAASDAYGPWLDGGLSKIANTSAAAFHHVDFQPLSSLSKAAGAPVTGLTTFYCDGAPGAGWLGDAAKAAELMGKADPAASGFLGLAYGITHEELSRGGVRGKAGVMLVGWESEAKRAAFRETPAFKECLGLLKGEAKAIEVVHLAFKQPHAE